MRTAHSLGTHTAETTFYTPFANLLNTIGERLKPRVHFQAHPGTHGGGLADGGLFPLSRRTQREPLPGQLPERGAVEIKPPGTNLATLAQSAQVRRYLDTYGLCLITNYHQFQLLDLVHGQPHILENYEITPAADAFWHAPIRSLATEHEETLADFLLRVMTRKIPLEKPKDVAWLLASYAREARARAARHPLAAFHGVKSALQESLGITFEGERGEHFFLSTLIQTLFYGIFSAWILWRRSPDYSAHNGIYNWRLSAEYLRVAVLRTLFHAVAEPGALNSVQITEVLDHATDALNRVQPDFFTTFREEDAVQYFYEPFLEAFDPELRKELGVWYTPREIVRYMVERVDHLLRSELNEPLGLASPNVQVLDPCCGTGAYLVEVLHRIERTLREQAGEDDALVGADLRRAATTRIFGFEIMPASFVIAHLQIAQLLEDARASLAATQRAQVFLTNALTGWVPARHPQSHFGFPAFVEERDAAEAVKQADTILVILGNPPYNGYAGIARIEEERDLTTGYRATVPGLPPPQGHGLNELYVRFFRVAERRVVGDDQVAGNRTGTGIVSFISGYSWLDGLSHPTMRHHMLNQFDSIYVDNLHGDRKITETTADGQTSETIFAIAGKSPGIKVGTAITTLLRKSGFVGHSATLQYRDFEDARAQSRRQHLLDSLNDHTGYQVVEPTPLLGLPLRPRVASDAFFTWPAIPEILVASSPGIKTSRDPLLVDFDLEKLIEKVRFYFDPLNTNDAVAQKHAVSMASTARFDAHETRDRLLARGFRRWQIFRYLYRPFDLRWIYWEPTSKLLDEKREGLLRNLHPQGRAIIAPQQNRVTQDGCQLTRSLYDINVTDGSASGFASCVISEQSLLGSDDSDNLINEARLYCQRLDVPYGVVFEHIVAVLHAPLYRLQHQDSIRRGWPRIPLPATAELLIHSANLGRRLAELLDPESSIELVAEWSFLARLILPDELPEGTPDRDARNAARLAVTAGWGGPGQGATVMPRRGDARERDYTGTELDRIATLAATLQLSADDALTLLGTRCVDVRLNDAALWASVPLNVWDYTLGGYQVLKKWLSYRELPLLGRPLHEDEARYFAQVVRRIAAILLLSPALDASYAAILPTATGLPT